MINMMGNKIEAAKTDISILPEYSVFEWDGKVNFRMGGNNNYWDFHVLVDDLYSTFSLSHTSLSLVSHNRP